jgi:predicted Zn-dependent peptidase
VGGYLNAFTAEEMTCYYAKASSTHLRDLLDVLIDMLAHASFPSFEIERERGVICEEIRMYQDQPGQVAQEKLNALLWPDHPLGCPLAGTAENIEKLKRIDLVKHRRKFYHAGNLWISVAGKTSLAKVKELLKPILHHFPGGAAASFRPVHSRQQQPRTEVIFKKIEQSHVALGLRGVSRHDPRRFAVRLLSVILGENMSSRLFQSIREKHGLAYSINSSASFLKDTGSFNISAGIENNKLTRALELILKELKKLAHHPPSAHELRCAKEYALGQMHLALESTTNQMMWMGENLIGHGRVLDPGKLSNQIEAVSREEIRMAARDLVLNHRLNLAVVSPTAQAKEVAKIARF